MEYQLSGISEIERATEYLHLIKELESTFISLL